MTTLGRLFQRWLACTLGPEMVYPHAAFTQVTGALREHEQESAREVPASGRMDHEETSHGRNR